jgi:hypothetical protein
MPGVGGALAGLALFILGGRAQAQVSVKTIAGGPTNECGHWAGFAGGDTSTAAQFNGPYACALDAQSNLYVADLTNRAVEEISLAGNLLNSTTFRLGVVVSKTLTNYQYFTNVNGVAVDAASNLYILEPRTLFRFPLTYLEASNLATLSFPAAQGLATALALDFNSNIFVAFATNGTNGSIVRYSQANGVFLTNGDLIVSNFTWQPAGIALRADGMLGVSDTLNDAIYVVATNSSMPVTPVLLTGGNGAGYEEGDSHQAQFQNPHGMAASADGRMVVCDTGNNRVRLIDTAGNTSLLYGTGSNLWPKYCCGCDPALYPGWVDGAAGSLSNDATGRSPISVTVSSAGTLFVTEAYYDLIRSVNGSGLTAVNLAAFLPVLQTLPATDITATNVTVNGTVNPGDETAGYYFAYGPTTNYGYYTPTNLVTTNVPVPATVSLTLTNLTPGTVYHFELQATNTLGSSVGGDQSFLTPPLPPTVYAEAFTNVITTNTTLTAIINPNDGTTTVYFQWGTTTNFGNTTTATVLTNNLGAGQSVTAFLQDLLPGTIYYFQVAAFNSAGDTYGTILAFSTESLPASVQTFPASGLTASSAILNAEVNPGGAVITNYFEWGLTTNYGNFTAPVAIFTNLTSTQPMVATLTNLFQGATYHFQAVAIYSAGTNYGGDESFTTPVVPTVTFGPSSGYFPECVTIMVTSSVQTVYYTTDGSIPTTNSALLMLSPLTSTNYTNSIEWCNSQRDLTSLQMIAVFGTNSSAAVQGTPATTNLIGFPRGTQSGSGATAYVPVVIDLQSGGVLESLQFRVEIAPVAGAPMISNVTLQPVTANDFVQFIGPAPGNTPVTFQTYAYTNSVNNAFGLVIATESGSGLNIQGFGVPVLLRVPVPKTAAVGQSYSMSVIYPSGTSDGVAAEVGMTNMPQQFLTITDPVYLEGDTAPANGYNASEFGNGSLDDSDANNILYAIVGIRKPYTDSDAFNAMDVYPETNGLAKFGEGFLVYLDWQITVYRGVGLNTNNWIRFWRNGARSHSDDFIWTPGGTPVVLSDDSTAMAPEKLAQTSTPPGLVWFCQASINAGSAVYQVPGNTCTVPISANVLPGYSLSGMDFRAIVTPDGDAPPVGQIQFNPAPGMPSPEVLPGLSSNDIICAWSLQAFEPPLQNSNYIGSITFQVPAGARQGQSYSLHFIGTGGAPDVNTLYQMESFPGTAWVLSGALQAPSITSDDWKVAFFGSVTNALAADDVDADGDGAPNWQEYLAGTDPTNALSCFQFSSATFNTTSGLPGVALNWLTAPGKTYIVESQPALGEAGWKPVNTNSGDGNYYQLLITNYSGNARFYQIRLQP